MARECVKRFGRIIMAAIVAITFAVAAFAVLVGCSKPEDGPPVDGNPSQYNVVYIAERGGHIDGDASQTVENNRDGTPVTAVADYGYTFSGWSDGVTSAERVEKNIGADVSVTARFTPIPLEKSIYSLPSGLYTLAPSPWSITTLNRAYVCITSLLSEAIICLLFNPHSPFFKVS